MLPLCISYLEEPRYPRGLDQDPRRARHAPEALQDGKGVFSQGSARGDRARGARLRRSREAVRARTHQARDARPRQHRAEGRRRGDRSRSGFVSLLRGVWRRPEAHPSRVRGSSGDTRQSPFEPGRRTDGQAPPVVPRRSPRGKPRARGHVRDRVRAQEGVRRQFLRGPGGKHRVSQRRRDPPFARRGVRGVPRTRTRPRARGALPRGRVERRRPPVRHQLSPEPQTSPPRRRRR